MYEVMVEGAFESAHNLRGYKGQCEKLHGHNWKVQAFLMGQSLSQEGFLIDFREVRSFLEQVTQKLDHTYLNEVPPFDVDNPTSELIARYIFQELSSLVKPKKITVSKVTVWESDSSQATYSQD